MTGVVDTSNELSPEHAQALQEFRKQLLDEGIIAKEGDTLGTQHDYVLLRFLRARKFNLKQSKAMIKNCIEWRKTVLGVGIDEIYKRMDPYRYPERADVFKHWPMWYHKMDKLGRPLNIQSLGSIDMTALNKVITPERHWEAVVCTSESLVREVMPASSYATGHVVDSCLIIVDLKGFGLGKFWSMKTLIRDSFQISQDYFPETMGHLAVINAPYSFAVMWNVVRSWLAKETQEKIHILSSDYESALLELVDAENLPESLGGTCKCEDKGGCLDSNWGPWMEGRTERREKWLKGEISRPGLGLEDREGSNTSTTPETDS